MPRKSGHGSLTQGEMLTTERRSLETFALVDKSVLTCQTPTVLITMTRLINSARKAARRIGD